MALHHWKAGARELYGAVVKRVFVTGAQRYVPELTAADFERAGTGVRAQAVGRDGSLIDDFALDESDNVVAVRNAPSPAATSSLAIAEYLAQRVLR
jgi:L-2-hydroxyglutarate oxidase LhgO